MTLEELNLRKFAVIFMSVYSIMPFVDIAVSVYLTTYAYMVFCVLFFILIVLGKKEYSMNEYFRYLIPFILYGVMTFFLSKDSVVMWGYSYLIFIMPVIVGVHIVSNYQSECASYSKIIILSIIITCITTARGLKLYPGAARWLATTDTSDNPMLITLSWMNVGGYDFIYTVVLLYPLLVLAFKRNKINLMLTLIIAAIVFWCLVSAEYTTALLLFVATSTMFFVKRKLRVSDIFTFAAIAVVFMIILSGVISRALVSISRSVESVDVASRLKDLSGGVKGLEGSEGGRLGLYRYSLSTFFKHPILGTLLSGGGGIGYHSFIFDNLAQQGIVGGLIIIFMYRKLYNLFYRKYEQEEDFGYIMWIFIQAILLSIVNTGMWLNVLALYVPIILSFLYGGSDEKGSLDSKYIAKTNQH